MQRLELKIRKLLLNNWFYYICAFISLMYAFFVINSPHSSIYDGNENKFEGVLISFSIKEDKLNLVIDAKEDLKCSYYFKNENDMVKTIHKLKLGSSVSIYGSLVLPNNNTIPNTFNYKTYLYNHGMFYTCKIDDMKIDDTKINVFYKIKNYVINRINSFDTTSDYLYTFILGDKSFLDENIMEAYRQNGVTHLFAISGMHIGLFASIILFVLKKLGVKENKRYMITISFIWFYAFLTGFPSSVLRAGLLFTLLTLNKIFYTEVKTLNVLMMTGTLLVLVKPFIILDIGFIYSFLTTFGLIYGSQALKKHKIIGTSLIAFLSSLPVTINNFYGFNVLSIFLNIIFVPFVSVIVYPLCLLTFIFKFLEPVFHFVLNILEWFSTNVSNITIFNVISPQMSTIMIIIYYAILLILLNRNFKVTVFLLFILVFINTQKYTFDSSFNVDVLDVGQGDSILIRTPGNRDVILIDTGGLVGYGKDKKNSKSDFIVNNLITYLKSFGINKINTIITSHGDADHIGEAINLVNNFKVEKVIFNCGPYNDLEKELIKVLDKKKIKYYSCIKELNIDKNILYFLQTKEYDNENDNSNVIYTELNGYKFMFMGDASTTTEKEILNKYYLSNIDVLKVGHHGSNTSSGKEFIDEINPKYSIISVGKSNRYGHPNKEVLENLKTSKIYRTDEDGSIMFKIKNNKLKIETCSP